MDKRIYEPREDSYLLLKHLKSHAKGSVLDMGTGSGILAREAAKYASVVAADINPEARFEADNIEFVESDLFENIDEEFDLIIFNPPYLPDDHEVKDIALDGGKEGYEIVERFLTQAKNHLKKQGKILLLFSSLTNKEVLDKILEREGYDFKQIDSQKLDFEELFVYLIEMK